MAAILKSKNRDIFTTVWPILTKFCVVTHNVPRNLTGVYNFRFLNIQDGRRPTVRHLANFLEI